MVKHGLFSLLDTTYIKLKNNYIFANFNKNPCESFCGLYLTSLFTVSDVQNVPFSQVSLQIVKLLYIFVFRRQRVVKSL